MRQVSRALFGWGLDKCAEVGLTSIKSVRSLSGNAWGFIQGKPSLFKVQFVS